MCDYDAAELVVQHGVTRRQVLRGALGAVLGGMLLPVVRPSRALASPLSNASPLLAAMHVHGSWSEGGASWEKQYANAAGIGANLLFMTDHDFRAEAWNYMTSLNGVKFLATSSGTFAQKATTPASGSTSSGAVRLLAESSGTSPAVLTLAVEEKPTAWNRLRTSIAGHTVKPTFGSGKLTNGARFEIVVTLSSHPAYGGHPGGQYELRYRFNATATSRTVTVEKGGTSGVVTQRLPAAGTAFSLSLVDDVQALWPDLLAVDNAFVMLSFVGTSPAKGAVADVTVSALQFTRVQNDEVSLITLQQKVVDTYASRYPGMTAYPSVEISRMDPHVIPFGVPQFWPKQSDITSTTRDSWYTQTVANVHTQGGLLSWNHPFGAQAGPRLSSADEVSKRHSVYNSMVAKQLFACDIIDVGYNVRGQVDTQTHLDLADTFSRNGIWLTYNGVNDDHGGAAWSTLNNGWGTVIWAPSTGSVDVVAALAAGRVSTHHVGRWPGGQLDLLVDGTVPMGKISVSSLASRNVAIFAPNLPAGSQVELVRGPVDYSGALDPGTVVAATITASSIGSSGTYSQSVDTGYFYRAQVRNSAGALIATGNPVWLLGSEPPMAVPAARRA